MTVQYIAQNTPSPAFYTLVSEKGTRCLIKLNVASLETNNGQLIKGHLLQLMEVRKLSSVILDMDQVQFVDSFGLASLLSLHKWCAKAGGKFVLLNPTSAVTQLLEVTKLSTLFPVLSDHTQAWETLEGHL
jgi:anti-anti-sigma factor